MNTSIIFKLDWTPVLKIAAEMEWALVHDDSLTEFAKALSSKVKERGYYSTAGIAKRMGNKVLEAIHQRLDSTRSSKNTARQTGRLRESIKCRGPFMDNYGNVTVLVGGGVPAYWKHQEFGTTRSRRVQEYMVVGVNVGAGRAQHNVTFSTMQDSAQIAKNYMTIPTSPGSASQRRKERATYFGKKVKLVSKKASYLARIKNKVALEFEHPGIKPRKFFAAGYAWLQANGSQFFAQEFKEVMAQANFEANYKTLRVLR